MKQQKLLIQRKSIWANYDVKRTPDKSILEKTHTNMTENILFKKKIFQSQKRKNPKTTFSVERNKEKV